MRLRIFTEPQNGASYDQQLAVAQLTEELGFDGFFRSDHYLRIGEGDPMPGPTDAWVTLGGLARETRAIRLGTLVTPVTFRLPGPLAISVAEVDVMSGGRVELGLGTGWYDDEHLAYGIPYPPIRQRFEMLEEQLEIVTGLWTTPVGQRFEYEGRHYRLSNSPALPKPFQRPHPPIILGGFGSRRTPALAARFASEFNVPFAPLALYRDMVQRVRNACADIGRDSATLRTTAALTVCCGRDDAELERRAAAIGRQLDELRANALAGRPNEVVDRLLAYRDAGAELAYLQVLDLDDLDHIRLLAHEVLPKMELA
ncbi:MAG: LLM class F420-dependent oxidoreductase [Actinobacteria bacterium]|nr:LLM class F420-dependent oxidoreductase [Actinomycetota bacterium]